MRLTNWYFVARVAMDGKEELLMARYEVMEIRRATQRKFNAEGFVADAIGERSE